MTDTEKKQLINSLTLLLTVLMDEKFIEQNPEYAAIAEHLKCARNLVNKNIE